MGTLVRIAKVGGKKVRAKASPPEAEIDIPF
jgi:hypothetical protein